MLVSPDTVAICMAVYNGAHYLEEQIESVLHQTHRDWVLFIRDGEVFHQLYRGEQRREQFYQKISDTLTMLATGGDRA